MGRFGLKHTIFKFSAKLQSQEMNQTLVIGAFDEYQPRNRIEKLSSSAFFSPLRSLIVSE